MCTNSAEMPFALIALIRSTTAGGKVFSIPKMIPILWATNAPAWDRGIETQFLLAGNSIIRRTFECAGRFGAGLLAILLGGISEKTIRCGARRILRNYLSNFLLKPNSQ